MDCGGLVVTDMDTFIDAVVIKYNPVTRTIDVQSNMTTFEALGLLEAAKAMIAKGWLDSDD
jgi:hypothetical protein